MWRHDLNTGRQLTSGQHETILGGKNNSCRFLQKAYVWQVAAQALVAMVVSQAF